MRRTRKIESRACLRRLGDSARGAPGLTTAQALVEQRVPRRLFAVARRRLVDEDRDAVAYDFGVYEPQLLLVAGLPEDPVALSEYDREDHQVQLIDQIVLSPRTYRTSGPGGVSADMTIVPKP